MSPDSSQILFNGSFPAEVTALPRIKSDILGSARQFGWSGDNLGRLELVLEEGACNIIHHAYQEKTGQIKISLVAVDDRLLLILQDKGIPFDPTSASVPDLNEVPEKRSIGGLGIHLMKSVAEKMEYRRDRDRNVLEITLNQKCQDDEP